MSGPNRGGARPQAVAEITMTLDRAQRDALWWWCDSELIPDYRIERDEWLRIRTAAELCEQIGWNYDDPRSSFTLTFDAAELERILYRELEDIDAVLADQAHNLARYWAGELTDNDVWGFDAAAWAGSIREIVDLDLEHREAVVGLLARLGEHRLNAWRNDEREDR